MTTFLFSNNAQTTLQNPISAVATSLVLSTGTGTLFPNPGAGQLFCLTMYDAATGTVTEIMHCTARSGDACTVVRAQEGTIANAWTAGDLALNLITSGTASVFLQTGSPAPFQRGTTGARPATPSPGDPYWDTTLGYPIWCDSTGPNVWKNSAGVAV